MGHPIRAACQPVNGTVHPFLPASLLNPQRMVARARACRPPDIHSWTIPIVLADVHVDWTARPLSPHQTASVQRFLTGSANQSRQLDTPMRFIALRNHVTGAG